MSKYAPRCKRTGNFPYVRTTHNFGRSHDTIVYAANLREAKGQHGWTRELHTSISIRRATLDDANPIYGWCACTAKQACTDEAQR